MRAAARADTIGGMSGNSNRPVIGWFLVVAGAVAALLIVWLGRIVRVPLTTLLHRAEMTERAADELRLHLRNANEDLRRTEAALTDGIAHARQVLAEDLNRLQDMQAADRAAARSRDEDLERRISQMVRRIEATLDGISDHQELLAGLRALVRMVRSDPA